MIQRVLSSPRRRRRLRWLVVPVVLAPLIFLGVHYSNSAEPGGATGPEVANVPQQKESPFTPAEQRAVRPVLKEFISEAVAREGVGRSWDIAGPTLKQDTTREQWNRGELPVAAYPAGKKGLGDWSFVNYSYTDTVGLEVVVFPKPGSGETALTADVELVKRSGRWLVDYWMARPFRGGPALTDKQARQAERKVAKELANQRQLKLTDRDLDDRPRVSAIWLAIPIGLLSLILVVPLTMWIVAWYRDRKATRAFEESSRT